VPLEGNSISELVSGNAVQNNKPNSKDYVKYFNYLKEILKNG